MVTEQDKDDFLEALYRIGSSDPSKGVSIWNVQPQLSQWDKDKLFDTASALEKEELIQHLNAGFLIFTLDGRRRAENKLYPPVSSTQNTINAQSITNSPIQQTGAYSNVVQTITYSDNDLEKVKEVVRIFIDHIDDLSLDATAKADALADIAVIKAQLAKSKPNIGFIKEAGRSLKNITEGAIGSLLAEAAKNTAIWQGIHQLMGQFF